MAIEYSKSVPIDTKTGLLMIGAGSDPMSMARGQMPGVSVVNKFGRNPAVQSTAVPEDIWFGGGAYAGFPTGAPEQFQIVLSSASDIGATVTFTYLPSVAATAWLTASVVTTALITNTGVSGIRCHTASFNMGAVLTFNVGSVTIRHITTTANVFISMIAGRSQSNVSAYTVPFGSNAYIVRLFSRVVGTVTGSVDGSLWCRELGKSPRLRRPFSCSNTVSFDDPIFGGVALSAGTDVVVRATAASALSLDVIAGYDLVVVAA